MIVDEDSYNEAVNKLTLWNAAYYGDGEPMVSDAEYDSLYQEVMNWENKTGVKVINTPTENVGTPVTKGIPHLTKMYSMANVYNKEELEKWLSKIGPTTTFYCSDKLDGISLNLIYNAHGKLTDALLRGDGVMSSSSVLDKAMLISTIPKQINVNCETEIRGEIVVSKKAFDALNMTRDDKKKFSNPRSAANGLISNSQTTVDELRYLDFVPWGIGYTDMKFPSHCDIMEHIVTLGFQNNRFVIMLPSDTQANDIMWYLTDIFNSRPYISKYAMDGIVIRVDDLAIAAKLGHTSKYPEYMVALKPIGFEARTILKEVIWQVGRTGVITPVGILEPVNLGGVEIKRVNLVNVRHIKELGVMLSDIVGIIRSGEVIPKLTNVYGRTTKEQPTPIKIPTHCPSCGKPVKEDAVNIYCASLTCYAAKYKMLVNFLGKNGLKVKPVKHKLIEKFVNSGYCENLSCLYTLNLSLASLRGGEAFGYMPIDEEVKKYIKYIRRHKVIKLSDFISGIGIPGIGVVESSVLADECGIGLFHMRAEQLKSIFGIGEKLADNVVNYINDNKHWINKLMKILNIIHDEPKGPLFNHTFCLSGRFPISRDEITSQIEKLGGRVVPNVTPNTNFLISDEIDTTKAVAAYRLGVRILSSTEFKYMIRNLNDS